MIPPTQEDWNKARDIIEDREIEKVVLLLARIRHLVPLIFLIANRYETVREKGDFDYISAILPASFCQRALEVRQDLEADRCSDHKKAEFDLNSA